MTQFATFSRQRQTSMQSHTALLTMKQQSVPSRAQVLGSNHDTIKAVNAIISGEYVSKAVHVSGVSRTTCARIKAVLKNCGSERLETLTAPLHNRADRRIVIKKDKGELIKQSVRLAAGASLFCSI